MFERFPKQCFANCFRSQCFHMRLGWSDTGSEIKLTRKREIKQWLSRVNVLGMRNIVFLCVFSALLARPAIHITLKTWGVPHNRPLTLSRHLRQCSQSYKDKTWFDNHTTAREMNCLDRSTSVEHMSMEETTDAPTQLGVTLECCHFVSSLCEKTRQWPRARSKESHLVYVSTCVFTPFLQDPHELWRLVWTKELADGSVTSWRIESILNIWPGEWQRMIADPL